MSARGMKINKNKKSSKKSRTYKESLMNVMAGKVISIKHSFMKLDLTPVETDKFNKTILWFEREFKRNTSDEQQEMFEIVKQELLKFDTKAAVVLEFIQNYLEQKRLSKDQIT